MSPDPVEKWVCVSCGYIYDPAAGDPAAGVPHGTPFERLPEGWSCPICYAAKSQFDRL
jgi:rubredoxin